MKKINILLTLAAVLISLNGFSQKIEDVVKKRNDIMALKDGEYELINVSIRVCSLNCVKILFFRKKV